ncbi:MAG: Cof-type HAD-IIB family hydrolase [Erysipelotrichaceae bacterium]|nr:Cof-type HAD-IIB family hydrolase [Erysipelotrichaceae bacterium]
MSYRMIVTDLDETLLNDQHQVGSRNKEWILKAKQQGVKVVLATGRHFQSVQKVLEDLALDQQENEYVISGNGAVITENKGNRILKFQGLQYEMAQQLVSYAKGKPVCVEIFTLNDIYFYQLNADERERMVAQKIDYKEIEDDDITFLKEESFIKVLYQSTDLTYLHQLEQQMQTIIENQLQTSYSSNRYLEFNRYGIHKGVGIQYLSSLLNIPLSDVIAVGDHLNDIAMLQTAGLAVAANNAIEEVKNIADVVTSANCNEGVLAEVIETYIMK